MKIRLALTLLLLAPLAHTIERQPTADYHARRVRLAERLPNGIALLLAAEEPVLDFMPYRQDEDFYYLTGWNEPGAALLIESAVPAHDAIPAQPYRETLFLPTRNLRLEKFTGIKLDAASPSAVQTTGVDLVQPLTDLPVSLTRLTQIDRRRTQLIYTQLDLPQPKSAIDFTAATLGMSTPPQLADVRDAILPLRAIKDSRELDLIRKATDASIAAQLAGMKAIHPGVNERKIAGIEIATQMANGCERPSYAPVVGSGINSTVLHYSANSEPMQSGDVVVIDAAGEYSMYASDITRTMPVNGHFTPRQREIYDIVLGAQQAAAAAFVAGKSKINDPMHRQPDSLDQVAFAYMNSHGKDLHGQPLGQYLIHGLGHLVGINVHDPWDYAKPLDKGMVFTIEPGIYIPEEHIGVRIEDVFYVDESGKLIDLVAKLPHTAGDIEKAMQP